jgi:hypothetical protein
MLIDVSISVYLKKKDFIVKGNFFHQVGKTLFANLIMEMIKSMKIIIDKSMETKISQNRGTLNIRRSSEGYKISDIIK